jgi:hypothetical protein
MPLCRVRYRVPWAELLKLTWDIDVKRCPKCGQRAIDIIAFITQLDVVHKILSHLRLPTQIPQPSPAQLPPQMEMQMEVDAASVDPDPDTSPLSPGAGLARGPP